jgi:tripartite-type tricarboxylate transporter receptor subunit TctC
VAPPAMTPAAVKVFRTAFAAMTKDEGFLTDAAKQSLEIDAMNGEEMQALIKSIGAIPPATLAHAKQVMDQVEKK